MRRWITRCQLGLSTQALADIDKAIHLDPSNIQFRSNRALLLRQLGLYLEAIAETITCRAVDLNPALRKDLSLGHELQIDSDQLISTKVRKIVHLTLSTVTVCSSSQTWIPSSRLVKFVVVTAPDTTWTKFRTF
jgi:tetratricopeptide (TPR) repeat protein